MNVLITGCAGFIGSSLVDKLLVKGDKVIGVDNFDPFYDIKIKNKNIEDGLLSPNFKLHKIDILDYISLNKVFQTENIEIVIHLAAKTGVRPSIENPEGYYQTNVIGTLNVLKAMKENNVNKLLFASSSSVYGNNINVPFAESDIVDNPISPYAATKKAGELICHTFHHLYKMDIFCLRFFTVYGPKQRPDLAIHKFYDLLVNDHEIPMFGDGSSKRDYTYIDDILAGIIEAINKVSGYEIINLGESRTISLIQMIELLAKNLNKTPQVNYLPMQAGDVLLTYSDISKARRILNYNPKFEFEQGLKEFINWKIKISMQV